MLSDLSLEKESAEPITVEISLPATKENATTSKDAATRSPSWTPVRAVETGSIGPGTAETASQDPRYVCTSSVY